LRGQIYTAFLISQTKIIKIKPHLLKILLRQSHSGFNFEVTPVGQTVTNSPFALALKAIRVASAEARRLMPFYCD
jgi:hypothetical protein